MATVLTMQQMAGWLHGVFVVDWLFVFPLCGFSLSLFCNRCQASPRPIARHTISRWRLCLGGRTLSSPFTTNSCYKRVKGRSHTVEKRKASHPQKPRRSQVRGNRYPLELLLAPGHGRVPVASGVRLTSQSQTRQVCDWSSYKRVKARSHTVEIRMRLESIGKAHILPAQPCIEGCHANLSSTGNTIKPRWNPLSNCNG